jgi:hypothetical protein
MIVIVNDDIDDNKRVTRVSVPLGDDGGIMEPNPTDFGVTGNDNDDALRE